MQQQQHNDANNPTTSTTFDVERTRRTILDTCAAIGAISRETSSTAPGQRSTHMPALIIELRNTIIRLSIQADINLYHACIDKIEVNNAKYPKDMCTKTVSRPLYKAIAMCLSTSSNMSYAADPKVHVFLPYHRNHETQPKHRKKQRPSKS